LNALAEFGHCPITAFPLLAYATSADCFTLKIMSDPMKQKFGLVRRPWGMFYLKNKITGAQSSLKTANPQEAQRLLHASNDAANQPQFNVALARVYLNGADLKLATRTCMC